MKKIISLVFLILISFISCDEKECCVNLEPAQVTLDFTHNWNETSVNASDFSAFKFTNENGEEVSIENLRYLLSKIKLTDTNNQEIVLKDYQLINIGEETGLQLITENIPTGNYNLSFTFGFSDADNQDGIYQDLNTANFNVPGMLGGGYHYMQFDGKYLDTANMEAPFNYHAIRAVDRSDPNNLILEDTSFLVDLGNIEISNDMNIEIKMDISEWFKNPNTWNLNELNTVLMPNFAAQKLISANGESVFSFGEITSN